MTAKLKAPFPYFGSKRRVAEPVWDCLGDPANYIEPFAGSAAVLLARPHAPRIETINDRCCYLVNFWRATAHDPEVVATYADWPVSEADLHARHRWLTLSPDAEAFRERMLADPDYFDAKFAGLWAWGLCCWIGSGWCSKPEHAKRPAITAGLGRGVGVHSGGRGVKSASERRAWLIDWFAQLRDRLRRVRVCCGHWRRVCDSESVTTNLGLTGCFVDPPYSLDLARMHAWLNHFQGRGPAPVGRQKETSRDNRLYSTDREDVDKLVAEVHCWALERGQDKRMRIVLAGYAGEHDALEQAGWSVVAWKAGGGYANRSVNHRSRKAVKEALVAAWSAGLSVRQIAARCGASHGLVDVVRREMGLRPADGFTASPKQANKNASRERLWISPHCLRPS